jgi:TrmH family RNA methyltransferase
MKLITSKDNPRLKTIRRLAQDSQAYRKLGLVWIEGDHLCRAALARSIQPELAIFSESIWQASQFEWAQCASEVWVVPDDLFASLSALESPAKMGFLMTLPHAPAIDPLATTVVLDRLQDAGNVVLFCAVLPPLVFNKCWPSKAPLAYGHPKYCVQAWGHTLD